MKRQQIQLWDFTESVFEIFQYLFGTAFSLRLKTDRIRHGKAYEET